MRDESTYIISVHTRHCKSTNDDKNDDLHTFHSCLTRSAYFLLMTSQSVADDATQWPDNWDAITWIVIFNSLGIDFIHGDIHDRSCKKFVIYFFWISLAIGVPYANNSVLLTHIYWKPRVISIRDVFKTSWRYVDMCIVFIAYTLCNRNKPTNMG